MKKIPAVFVCVFLSILSSCSRKNTVVNTSSSERPVIGFSIDTLIVERWRKDCGIFVETARKNSADVIIQDAANSVEEQIRQIEALISKKVDVLVIVPKETESLSAVLDKAKSKKIPVISYDRLIRGSDIDLYVSVDSKEVGRLMAEAMLSVQKTGGYWCLLGPEEDYNMILADWGIREVLSRNGISVDLKYFTPDWNYDLAYQKMNALLDNNLLPSAVICGNDAVAENVLRSISEHRLGKKIPVVGQDAEVLACRRVAQGVQTATVYKPISELAEIAADYACRIAANPDSWLDSSEITDTLDNGVKQVPALLLKPVLVTKENLKETVIDSKFHTYEEIYR